MAILSKDPEKAARKEEERRLRKEEAERARQEEERRRAEQAFRASPQGRARTAKELGHQLFQISMPLLSTERTFMGLVSGDKQNMRTQAAEHADVLAGIESEGWRLDHVGYVFRETGAVSRDKLLSSGQTSAVTGEIWGIYLFRATQ